MRIARDVRFERGVIDSLRRDGIGVPHRDRTERAAALMRRLSYSDFGGRMRFTSLGTAGDDRVRRARSRAG